MKKISQNIFRIISLSFILGIVVSCSDKEVISKEPVDYVNPYIGNISHLLVPAYPTIHLPNSMLRVYPEREDYTGNKIKGLPVIVTSHRGNSAFSISPLAGNKQLSSVIPLEYDNEVIKPYFYRVFLNEDNIDVEYVPSYQSAIYKFQFSEGAPSFVINSKNGILKANGSSVSGYQQIGDFPTKVYLYLETDIDPERIDPFDDKTEDSSCLVMRFTENSRQIHIRYGISFISEEQAKKNLYREVKNASFDEVKEQGRAIWNETLSKIKVEGDCEDAKAVFYTSLYRTYERMICISEDGMYYSSFDDKVHGDNGIPFYTDDWIWDTYRATHPLRVIIEPEKEVQMINSFVRMAEQMDNFWMPTFPEITGDSRRMNSNHGVATVIDAYVKGLKGFNLELAYDACKRGITEKTLIPWSGDKAGVLDDFYKKNGYFPALRDGEIESVANVNNFEKRQPVAVT